MRKRFCDFCDKEITDDEIYTIEFYDENEKEEIFTYDACKQCKDKASETMTSMAKA